MIEVSDAKTPGLGLAAFLDVNASRHSVPAPPTFPRIRAAGRWLRSHPGRSLALAALVAFALLNALTFRHIWVMTHFSAGGESTARPEELSKWARARVLLLGINVPRPTNERTPADFDLPFETHWALTDDGIEIETWHVPHADPRAIVAMFHGYHACKAQLLETAHAFHVLGCSVILADFRGSGGSSGNTTTLGMRESADVSAVCRLAQTLAPDRPLVLYGTSMGSVAILRAIAQDRVTPAGMIIECPFDRLLATVRHRFTAMGLPSTPFAELLVFWGGVQHGINAFAHNPVEYASQVECPALVMHGESDPRVDVPEVQAVYAALRGEKQLEIFPEVGHELCFRSRPDLWTRHVTGFLDRVVPENSL